MINSSKILLVCAAAALLLSPARAATISMNLQAAPATSNLTTLGVTDWVYFRTSTSRFEMTGGTAIGAATVTSTLGAQFDNGASTVSWTNNAIAPASGSDSDFMTANAQPPGSGRFTVPVAASTTAQRLYVLFGGRSNPTFAEDKTFTLAASLNDGSGATDSESFLSLRNGGTFTLANNLRLAVIDFTADSASTLTLDLSLDGVVNSSYAVIQYIALEPAPVPEPAVPTLLLGIGMLVVASRRRQLGV